MKKGYFRGWRSVFSFTLNKSVRNKSFAVVTVVFALIFFTAVFAVTALPSLLESKEDADSILPPDSVIICDTTTDSPDYSWLNGSGGDIYSNVEYSYSGSVADADARAAGRTLIVTIAANEDGYKIEILRPSSGDMSNGDTAGYRDFFQNMFRYELIRRSGVDASLLGGSAPSVDVTDIPDDIQDTEDDPYGSLRSVVEMIVSYITIFVMYFMILIYGQGAANSVMLEKTSKLMDFFLVSVKPAAMILGKVLAVALAAIIQVCVWLAGAAGGYLGGRLLLKLVLKDAAGAGLAEIFEPLSGLFTPGGIIVAILVVVAGFLLYCALASLGGAMASKPEDLSSTNSIFAMVLVVSFLLSLYSGSSSGMVSTASWLIYFPFTAILVTPGRALTGSVGLVGGLVSALIVMLTAFAAVLLAGKVYTMMSFWRGNPPTPLKMLGMVRDSLKKSKK